MGPNSERRRGAGGGTPVESDGAAHSLARFMCVHGNASPPGKRRPARLHAARSHREAVPEKEARLLSLTGESNPRVNGCCDE